MVEQREASMTTKKKPKKLTNKDLAAAKGGALSLTAARTGSLAALPKLNLDAIKPQEDESSGGHTASQQTIIKNIK
jgi:hypothetical protein